ncbi:MAG: YjbH domain-containing protein, partial [Shewanella sp.]
QPFSWFEATLRYTDVRTQLYGMGELLPDGSYSRSGDQSYKDKGLDGKLRLWMESAYLPQVAIGVRDVMGTGLFDSEYVVASKRYKDLDFTLGLAWGNMGQSGNSSNPFCEVSDSWCERDDSVSGNGGKFELGKMFHGPAAWFGGVEYQTPWRPLRLKLEYDGNDYSREFATDYGALAHDSAWNFGAVYRVNDNLETQLSWQRGNTLMWGATFRTNFNELSPAHLDVAQASYQPAQVPTTLGAVAWADLSNDLATNAGWQQADIYLNQTQETPRVMVLAKQGKYRDRREAYTRASVLAANALPLAVEQVTLLERKGEFLLQESVMDLASVRAAHSPQVLGQEQVARIDSH